MTPMWIIKTEKMIHCLTPKQLILYQFSFDSKALRILIFIVMIHPNLLYSSSSEIVKYDKENPNGDGG